MSDPGTLQLLEVAVGENTSLKKMIIEPSETDLKAKLTWTNITIAILKGAAKNETLGTLELGIPDEPPLTQELVDEVRRLNPKLQLTVWAGSCESEHVTVGMPFV